MLPGAVLALLLRTESEREVLVLVRGAAAVVRGRSFLVLALVDGMPAMKSRGGEGGGKSVWAGSLGVQARGGDLVRRAL